MAQVDGRLMLDGGIVDSIPIVRAQEQGYEKCIVVLTRNKGYRKKESNMKLPFFIYRKYPELRSALTKRNELYNGQLELVERLEEQGKVVVIRPKNPLSVGRMETNVDKLTALYNEGYACAKELFE
jgi:predicted patatin/cPLA2 family phospholipase